VTRLFQDYIAGRDEILSFYEGDWRNKRDWKLAAERTLAYQGPRAEVARLLADRNKEWLTDKARDRIEAVESGSGVVIVAGQQTGLLTGPLYTIHKAITVLKLADWAESELGLSTLPVFWAGANDSDLEEAGQVTLIDSDHNPLTFSIAGSKELSGYEGWPMGRIPLGGTAAELNSWVEESSPGSEFVSDLMDQLGGAYHSGATVGDAFVRLLGTWLGPHGLVILDPTWPELRPASSDLYRRVFQSPQLAGDSLERGGEALKAAGYHVQLSMPSNRMPLFATMKGAPRRPLIPLTDAPPDPESIDGWSVEVEGHGSVVTGDLLDPEGSWEVDPNAALRPVLQDHLLPTMAFVAGPAEIAYFGQVAELYTGLGVPRPVTMPRARALLVPTTAERVLDKYDLQAEALADGPRAAGKQIAREQFPDDLEDAFVKSEEAITGRMESLKQRVISFEPTLEKPFETSAGRMASELRKLKEKAVAGRSRQQETLQAQLARAAAWLYPDGSLQERRLSIIPFAVRYGAGTVIELLVSQLDPRKPESVQQILFRP
jgi:bacillithiol biosynthesis cysteine-adding enzyme BshC